MDSEKRKIFILLGSIRDPLHFFKKMFIPNDSKESVGAKSLEIPWVVTGRGVGSPRKSQLVPLRVSAALSVTGAERTSPGMASGLSPVTRLHKQSSLPPGLGGNGGGKRSLLRAARRARHHEGGRTVSIRKSWSHTWY